MIKDGKNTGKYLLFNISLLIQRKHQPETIPDLTKKYICIPI